MTIAEKLQFLSDRLADGREFTTDYGVRFYLDERGLWQYSLITGEFEPSYIDFNNLVLYFDLKEIEFWFTSDEKAILRNLPEQYKWLFRDKYGTLYISRVKPRKYSALEYWSVSGDSNFQDFNHLFQSVQWTDKEPCEFRKYI